MTDHSAVTDSPARAVERLIWQEADQVRPEQVAVQKILADPVSAAKKVGLTPETVVEVLKSRTPTFAGWRARRERMAEERELAEVAGESVFVTRRRMSQSTSAAVSPGYLVSVLLIITGLTLDFVGHTNPFPYAPLAVFGPIVIGVGVGLGMIQGGLGAHPTFVLAVTAIVIIGLLAVGYYNVGGAQAWGL